jgi:hypothetical protein
MRGGLFLMREIPLYSCARERKRVAEACAKRREARGAGFLTQDHNQCIVSLGTKAEGEGCGGVGEAWGGEECRETPCLGWGGGFWLSLRLGVLGLEFPPGFMVYG